MLAEITNAMESAAWDMAGLRGSLAMSPPNKLRPEAPFTWAREDEVQAKAVKNGCVSAIQRWVSSPAKDVSDLSLGSLPAKVLSGWPSETIVALSELSHPSGTLVSRSVSDGLRTAYIVPSRRP